MAMLSNYILLMFAISIVFFLAGYQPILVAIMTNTVTGQSFINALLSIFNPFTTFGMLFYAAIGISIVTSFLGSGGNFSVFFVIPIIMLAVVMQLLVMPLSYLLACDPNLIDCSTYIPLSPTSPMGMIITGFFYLLMMLAIFEFVRGGSV